MEEEKTDIKSAVVDIYRDTPLRLLGYSNEVGEAFRPLVNVNWVRLSYGIASVYVLADTSDKALKVTKDTFKTDRERNYKLLTTTADTLLWQSFASIIIPGFTINRLCAGAYFILKKTTKLPKGVRKWITTGIGLASIPFIIKPIDRMVDKVMDTTFRKWV